MRKMKHYGIWLAAALLLAAVPGGGKTLAAEAPEDAETAEAAEQPGAEPAGQGAEPAADTWCGLTYSHSMELEYAQQFAVDYYEGGYVRITIAGEDCFLLIPEGGEAPQGLDDSVTVLQKPVQNIYLVATSAMDLFCSLDALDSIRLSGTDANGWYVPDAKAALEDGRILYAGKYSAPDYELIVSEDCGLAIESTMIYHNPEVQEKLEEFGIPVLVERSSYESHPMGRAEWMKLYGALLGLEDKAEEVFAAQTARLREIESSGSTGKTVAFFYIGSNGYASVRKSSDYVSMMIELAGGHYIFEHLGDDENALSTVNMTMEEFYAQAKDADYIIYNSTIDGEINTIDELLGKSELLADFKAVQDGNVWCTGKNLFQETTSLGDMIADIHTVLTEPDVDEAELTYLHRVE